MGKNSKALILSFATTWLLHYFSFLERCVLVACAKTALDPYSLVVSVALWMKERVMAWLIPKSVYFIFKKKDI